MMIDKITIRLYRHEGKIMASFVIEYSDGHIERQTEMMENVMIMNFVPDKAVDHERQN